MSVFIFNHPLINDKITIIRNKNTNTKDFWESVKGISRLMTYEVTKDLKTKEIEIETPICKTKKPVLDNKVEIIPILRAGLGMVDGIRELIPSASVGFIGLYRDEQTLLPHEYYAKYSKNICDDNTVELVVDPMLATAGSAISAIEMIKKRGAKNIKFLCLVAAPIGIEKLKKAHPDIDIYIATVDEKLNEKGYIVPGLGDCGDRLFGTI